MRYSRTFNPSVLGSNPRGPTTNPYIRDGSSRRIHASQLGREHRTWRLTRRRAIGGMKPPGYVTTWTGGDQPTLRGPNGERLEKREGRV